MDGPVLPRTGQFCAWLQKKKSGSSMVRMRQYNRRYFTIDYDLGIFFYAHGDIKDSKRQAEYTFADIMDARVQEPPQPQGVAKGKSLLRRSMSGMSSGGDKEHPDRIVIVAVRPAKQMELLCSSSQEAGEWAEAFQAAIAQDTTTGGGGGGGTGGGVVGFGSMASDDEGDGGARSGGSSPRGDHQRRARDDDDHVGRCSDVEDLADDEPRPAPNRGAPGTFLDFAVDPEPQVEAGPAAAAAAAAAVEVPEADAVVETGKIMQASDFGFAAGDEGDASDATSSVDSIPEVPVFGSDDAPAARSSPAGAFEDAAPERGGSADASPERKAGSSARPGSAGSSAAYEDKNPGLSMQERLATLELSDCESDDDPLGLGAGASDKQAVPA